jgi:hypothetical protein
MNLREHFPDAIVIEHDNLVHEEEVGSGPWRIYCYREDGYHTGGAWFNKGKMKYPNEEITFAHAKECCDQALAAGCEVRICDGMDHLVFHAVGGEVVFGNWFWNAANPHPVAAAVAKQLIGKGKK